jgi:hypothetical protein
MKDRLWLTRVEISPEFVHIQVTEFEHGRVLDAKFYNPPAHPRALVFVLEGLALWVGRRLSVVICADKPAHPLLGLGVHDDEWPYDNPLLDFAYAERRACCSEVQA